MVVLGGAGCQVIVSVAVEVPGGNVVTEAVFGLGCTGALATLPDEREVGEGGDRREGRGGQERRDQRYP